MTETKTKCPRCGERAEDGWSYCPHCAMVLAGSSGGQSTLSDRIRYVQRGTENRQRRNAIIQSLANLSIGIAILFMLGGGIVLFHPSMVPRLFQPKVSFVMDEISRVTPPEEVPTRRPPRVDNEWVRVEKGEFLYGTKENAETIDLPTFEIQKYEVTNVQWGDYLESEKSRLEDRGLYEESVPRDWGWDPESGDAYPPGDIWDLPVTNITWYQAQDYCEQYLASQPDSGGARLPTPYEWVKAARGPEDARRYPWGDEFFLERAEGEVTLQIPRCNTAEWGLNTPKRVDQFERDVSFYGVIGLAGNVSEFVGVPSRGAFAFRGGSFQDDSFDARIDVEQTPLAPGTTHRWIYVGFRAARSVEEED